MALGKEKPWLKRISRALNTKTGITLTLVGPIQFLLFLILLTPFLIEIYLSLTNWDPTKGSWWMAQFDLGLSYLTLLRDKRFLYSLGRTAMFVLFAVGGEFLIGLYLANLVSKSFRGKKAVFSILLLPMFMMPLIVGYAFWMIFQPSGPLDHVLTVLTGINFMDTPWLAHGKLAWIALILTDIWHWTPFMFLILYSGLMSIPENPVSAAKVLGASDWQVFKDIKLPMLRNIIIIALVIRAMEAMKFFDELYLMTGGGPGFDTETISMYTFTTAVINSRIGYGSAAALIILLISLILITFAVRPVLLERER
ncbi:MAG: sugar ABC transporter permease [Nitrososphaerota archaeon]